MVTDALDDREIGKATLAAGRTSVASHPVHPYAVRIGFIDAGINVSADCGRSPRGEQDPEVRKLLSATPGAPTDMAT